MANSINFVIAGDQGIAAELGKKGTSSDITIYDRKTPDAVYTWTVANTFPDKIQSLMQAVNIAEYAILNVTKLDKFLGEQIIALDSAGFGDGFIIHSYDVDRDKLQGILKNTPLSKFRIVDNLDQLKQDMSSLKPKSMDGPIMIPVDHAFDVKGVGTVILGVVKQGKVKVHDELKVMPSGNDLLVKSIQMHDDPVEESSSPARVGLAIKGLSADKVSRGDVICHPDTVSISSGPISATFEKNVFFKGEIAENQVYMVSTGLQIKPAKVKMGAGKSMQIGAEKQIVYRPGQKFALLKPDNQGTRIIGSGTIEQ